MDSVLLVDDLQCLKLIKVSLLLSGDFRFWLPQSRHTYHHRPYTRKNFFFCYSSFLKKASSYTQYCYQVIGIVARGRNFLRASASPETWKRRLPKERFPKPVFPLCFCICIVEAIHPSSPLEPGVYGGTRLLAHSGDCTSAAVSTGLIHASLIFWNWSPVGGPVGRVPLNRSGALQAKSAWAWTLVPGPKSPLLPLSSLFPAKTTPFWAVWYQNLLCQRFSKLKVGKNSYHRFSKPNVRD